jgi:hypothetical protein
VREGGGEYRMIGPAYVKRVINREKWDEEKERDITLI